jgi:hypothetical protein
VGLVNFLVMMGAFTGGISVVAFAIAAAKRFAAGGDGSVRAVRELHDEVEQLRGEIDRLRNDLEHPSRPPELEEIQNRLDFAERMLAQVRARDALPGPR